MFRSEALLGVPIQFRGSIQRETLDNMVSALRSAKFEQLALPLLPSLYNHAFWLTRNHAEAEDLVQETFSKALRAFDSFQADANFKGWTFRILCNTFFTSRTGIAASRTVFLEDHQHALDTTDTSPTPEDNPIRLDNQAGLQRALEQLEPQLREALLLCDVEEVKYRDIALILDIPIGTVMSRISRARLPLRHFCSCSSENALLVCRVPRSWRAMPISRGFSFRSRRLIKATPRLIVENGLKSASP
jgi:RNA polymerase sigma-70 factor, ECF subfamily